MCGCGHEIIAQYKEMVCVLGVSFVGGAVHGGLCVGSLRGGGSREYGSSAGCGLELQECLSR